MVVVVVFTVVSISRCVGLGTGVTGDDKEDSMLLLLPVGKVQS